jgi:hypothetical protein
MSRGSTGPEQSHYSGFHNEVLIGRYRIKISVYIQIVRLWTSWERGTVRSVSSYWPQIIEEEQTHGLPAFISLLRRPRWCIFIKHQHYAKKTAFRTGIVCWISIIIVRRPNRQAIMNTHLCTHTHGHLDGTIKSLKYKYHDKTTNTITSPSNFAMNIMGRPNTYTHAFV